MRHLFRFVAILALMPIWLMSTAPVNGQALQYKYAFVEKSNAPNIQAVNAAFETANPVIRDNPGTHSLIQHWVGDPATNNWIEVGWRKNQFQSQQIQLFWSSWKDGVWGGYHFLNNPSGSSHAYRINYDESIGCWRIIVDNYYPPPGDPNVGPCNLPPPGDPRMQVVIRTGGEITYDGSPYDQMGIAGISYMGFKNLGIWSSWVDSDMIVWEDDTTNPPGNCPLGGSLFRIVWLAVDARQVWGCYQ